LDVRLRDPLESHSSQLRHFLAGAQLLQAVDGGFDEIDGVGAAMYLGQDVMDAGGDEDIADAGAGLDAGAGAGRDQDDLAGAVTANLDNAFFEALAARVAVAGISLVPGHVIASCQISRSLSAAGVMIAKIASRPRGQRRPAP